MKKMLFIFVLLVVAVSAMNAQDVITMKNGDEIKTKVLEISANEVKYKKFGNANGPTYTILKSEIFMIKYENGEKDVFNKTSPKPAEAEVKENTEGAEKPARTGAATQRAQRDNTSSATQGQQQNRSTQSRAVAERPEPKAVSYQENTSAWPYRKAYIGIGFGGAFLSEDYSNVESSGTLLDIKFGYLFTENIGVTVNMLGGTFGWESSSEGSVNISCFTAGPLFSTAIADGKVEFDGRPMIGFAQEHRTGKSYSYNSKISFATGVGGSVRFNLSSRFSLSGNMDYSYTKIEGDDDSFLGISVGINFRF
ncbi:MAG: porin family protein [Candidatus Symbiothrix sp.]|jgi:opacity protein-like surface antigen|nr:porin family protein [Candidatus Symbiothrix sp.]